MKTTIENVKVGQEFEITHSDGFVAKEKVCKILNGGGTGGRGMVVCESASVYCIYDVLKVLNN